MRPATVAGTGSACCPKTTAADQSSVSPKLSNAASRSFRSTTYTSWAIPIVTTVVTPAR